MKILKTIGTTVVAGLLLAGCSSVAHVEKDDNVNLADYHSFAWVDTKSSASDSGKSHVSDLTERRIKEAVSAELAKAGWKESKRPDVLLTYDVLIERSTREQNNPVYTQPFTRYVFNPYTRRYLPIFYPSQFLGYDREQQAVREGTVTISLVDARTEKTVWQGWTTDEVDSRNLTSKEIQSAVKSIFRKFDVAKN